MKTIFFFFFFLFLAFDFLSLFPAISRRSEEFNNTVQSQWKRD